ncbi:MAG: hypothetical protein ABIF71_01690 [Planctomycetota bacterium]
MSWRRIFFAAVLLLGCGLIVLPAAALVRAPSRAALEMQAEELRQVEAVNRDLLKQLAVSQEGRPLEYKSGVVLSIGNQVLNKMEAALFPVDYTLTGTVAGTVRAERLTDFQFTDDNRIIFRLKLTGRDLRYNPRGDGLVDRMLGGLQVVDSITLEGTGVTALIFDEPGQRIDLRTDVAGIDFQSDLPPFVEQMIKDRFATALQDQPHFVDLDFKPVRIALGDRVRWGYYHVREVVTRSNRLMAMADLEFRDEPPPDKKKHRD